MSIAVGKEFRFAASHVLNGLPPGHKCGRLHGHSYTVRVELRGSVDLIGFVVDFAALDTFSDGIRRILDHQHLNDVLDFNPTSELLAQWIGTKLGAWANEQQEAARIDRLKVTVSEGPSTWATFVDQL